MACPRCNGRMFHEQEIGSDKVIPTCLMCGYEDYQRPTFDLDKVWAEIKTERRSNSSSKRPSMGVEA